jgi:hypothetical protein
MPITRSIFSAANASVQIAGKEIGQLQSLNAQINYNIQEIRNLYQNNIQAFPRGITTISLTARRALIDTDGMFGNFDTIAKIAASLDKLADTIPDTTLPFGAVGQLARQNPGGTNTWTDVAATGLQAARFFGSSMGVDKIISGPVAGIKNLQELLIAIKNGVSTIGDFFAKVPFDVVVKMDSNIPASSSVDTFFSDPITIWKFENCIIGSRTFSLDINNIILMEECSIACQKFIEMPTVTF